MPNLPTRPTESYTIIDSICLEKRKETENRKLLPQWHVWDTVDLFYPWVLVHLWHTWDTVDLFYPWVPSRLIRHAWDTVDLFYPWVLVRLYDIPGIQWTYSIPGSLVASYDMPGIQWTYSIPGSLFASMTCLGYSGPILSLGPCSPLWHTWDTVDLFYPRDLSLLIRHAWDTVDLFYLWVLVRLYDIPGIQWTYSIPGTLVSSYDMPGIQWTYSISGSLFASMTCLGYSGPILSPDPHRGLEVA